MTRNLFVGNLMYRLGDGDLRRLFANHGDVLSAQVAMDRDTGRSKGFGFVEMASELEAGAAVAALNGTEVGGCLLIVAEAQAKKIRPRKSKSDTRGDSAAGPRRGTGGGGRGKTGRKRPAALGQLLRRPRDQRQGESMRKAGRAEDQTPATPRVTDEAGSSGG